MSLARSTSTLVFSTMPPRPRIACKMTSISPSSSGPSRAEVSAFINFCISWMNSSTIPMVFASADVAPPTSAPMAAPVIGAARRKPARTPSVPQARMVLVEGSGCRSRVYEPSECRTRIAVSKRSRYCWGPARRVISSRASSARAESSYPMAQRCAVVDIVLPHNLHDPPVQGRQRTAAMKEKHEKQCGQAERGLIAERIHESVHDRLHQQAGMEQGDGGGVCLRMGKAGRSKGGRAIAQRILRRETEIVQRFAQPARPEAALTIDDDGQDGDAPASSKLALAEIQLHALAEQEVRSLPVDQRRDGANLPTSAEAGEDQRQEHGLVGSDAVD